MSVTISIDGRGTYAGLRSNIVGYSVSEDATPIDGSDSAAVGELSFSVVEDPSAEGTIRLLGTQITLDDTRRGSTVGVVDSIETTNGVSQIRAGYRLNRLVVDRKATPFVGTFGQAIRYYLSLAGVAESIVISDLLEDIPVALQGWEGSVWREVTHLCMAHRAEIQQVANNIVIRPIRQYEAVMNRNISERWSIDSSQRARTVQVAYYDNKPIVNTLVFPPKWADDETRRPTPYRVDKYRMVEDEVEVSASLTSVDQPMVVDSIPPGYAGIQSIYAVRTEDRVVSAAEWASNGGRVEVEVGEKANTIKVRIYAPTRGTAEGPYALEDSEGNSTLYLVGDGVEYHRQVLTLSTGADPNTTAQVLGETVDFPEVSTLGQAWTIGLHTAAKWGSPRQTVNISTTSINRRGESGDYTYPTWAEVEEAISKDASPATPLPANGFGTAPFGSAPFGMGVDATPVNNDEVTWASFDATWDGYSWDNFDDYWAEQSQDQFVNQGFGNMTGAAARFRDGIYRVTSHTTDDVTVNYTAEQDALFSDVEALWEESTWADFDEFWQYNTWSDVDVSPLKNRAAPTNEPVFRTPLPSLFLLPQSTLLPNE